jgi:hypothetical protein
MTTNASTDNSIITVWIAMHIIQRRKQRVEKMTVVDEVEECEKWEVLHTRMPTK